MYACFNGATTMPYGIMEDIAAAARAGFPALEVWGPKLERYLLGRSLASLRELLQAHLLQPAAIDFVAVDLASPEPLAGALHDLPNYGEVALSIGCDTLLAIIVGDRPELTEGQGENYLAKLMLPLCAEARRYGLRLALEPLSDQRYVAGPRQAMELVRLSKQDNLGISLDLFHFYRSGLPLDDLLSIAADRLYIVHAADAPAGDRVLLRDQDRIWPGEGVMPLDAYWDALQALHYVGPVSVEVPNPEYARMDPETLARMAYVSLARYLPVPA